MRNVIRYGRWIRSQDPEKQLAEVITRFLLKGKASPLTICSHCNGRLEKAAKESVRDQVPEKAWSFCESFYRCRRCGRVYWKGSHYPGLKAFLDKWS